MRTKTLTVTRIGLLLGLTLAFQMIGLPQPATGPVINAVFFLSCALFGPWTAVILGLLTPVAALVRGQLPPPLWPLLPCLGAANAVLSLSFHWVRGLKAGRPFGTRWMRGLLSIVFPSLLKFGFLSVCVKTILPPILGRSLPPALVFAFTGLQLITALAGGILALSLLKVLKADLAPSPR